MEPTELPTLRPDVVEDDEALGALVDAVVRLDPVARDRATAIDLHMGWLRCAVDADTWRLVIDIETRTAERWADLAIVLVKWGFEQGRRFPATTGVTS